MNLALTLAALVGSLVAVIFGFFKPNNFRYHLFQVLAASILAVIGSGLMTLFTTKSVKSVWIGFQAMLGLGIGVGVYMPATFSVGYVLDKHKLNVYGATALIEALTASIFHSVAQSIFVNTLHSGLKARIPGFDQKVLMHTGVTTFASTFPPDQRPLALQAYNAALINVFHLGTALCSFGIFGSFWVLLRRYKRRRAQTRSSAAAPLNGPVMSQAINRSRELDALGSSSFRVASPKPVPVDGEPRAGQPALYRYTESHPIEIDFRSVQRRQGSPDLKPETSISILS
jgi:hypothetical protein